MPLNKYCHQDPVKVSQTHFSNVKRLSWNLLHETLRCRVILSMRAKYQKRWIVSTVWFFHVQLGAGIRRTLGY